jgi:hypothetical protein
MCNLHINIHGSYTINFVGCKQDNTSHAHLLFDCFCNCFWRNIPRLFLEYSWKSLQKKFQNLNFFLHIILLRFMLNFWQNMSFSKKLKSIYMFFYYLKTSFTMFNGCFCQIFIHWINFKLIHIFSWYIKSTII